MPDTIVRALIKAFNVSNYDFDTVKTNFTLQSRNEHDYIVVSFDKGVGQNQCKRYLKDTVKRIVSEFHKVRERDTDEVVLNTAKLIFDVKSFPFDLSKGQWSEEQGGLEFVVPIDQGVIFNLKSYLASSLAKNVLEDMQVCRIVTKASDEKGYLWHGKFPNKGSSEEFRGRFILMMKQRYTSLPDNPLKIKGNDVYIRDIFNDVLFIDSITQHAAWLIGRDLQANSEVRSDVKAFKDLMIEFIGQSTELMTIGFMCAPPLNGKGASILIPVVQDDEGVRLLRYREALDLNDMFEDVVFSNFNGKTRAELSVNGSSEIYGIDFYNPQVSYCVVTKIIENSVINKDHELSIDPNLSQQSPSPTLSDPRPESSRPDSKTLLLLPGEAGLSADESTKYATKERILRDFIASIPIQNKNTLESLISESLPSLERKKVLYPAFLFSYERGKKYLELRFSPDEIIQAESNWFSELSQLGIQDVAAVDDKNMQKGSSDDEFAEIVHPLLNVLECHSFSDSALSLASNSSHSTNRTSATDDSGVCELDTKKGFDLESTIEYIEDLLKELGGDESSTKNVSEPEQGAWGGFSTDTKPPIETRSCFRGETTSYLIDHLKKDTICGKVEEILDDLTERFKHFIEEFKEKLKRSGSFSLENQVYSGMDNVALASVCKKNEAEQPFSRGEATRNSGRSYADKITQQRQKDKDVKVVSHS